MANNRRNWSPEEDELLKNAVLQALTVSDIISWPRISKHVPGRNNKDCRKRWVNTLASVANAGPWSPSEDERLTEAVMSEGPRWTKVSAKVRTRSGDQCAKHWTQTSNPEIDRKEWTKDEDDLLIQAFKKHGPNWAYICRHHFPTRSALASKNRFSCIARMHKSVAGLKFQADRSSASTATPVKQAPIRSRRHGRTNSTSSSIAAASEDTSSGWGRSNSRTSKRLTIKPRKAAGSVSESSLALSPVQCEDEAVDGHVHSPCSSLLESETASNRVHQSQESEGSLLDGATTLEASTHDELDWAEYMDFDFEFASKPSNWDMLQPTTAAEATSSTSAARQLPPTPSSVDAVATMQVGGRGQDISHQSTLEPLQPQYSHQNDVDQRLISSTIPAVKNITIHATCTDEQISNLMQAAVSNSISWQMTSD